MIFYNTEIFRLALCVKLGFLTAPMSLRERHFTVRHPEKMVSGMHHFASERFLSFVFGASARVKAEIFLRRYRTEPNQALLPTPISVTPAAGASVAPDIGAADL